MNVFLNRRELLGKILLCMLDNNFTFTLAYMNGKFNSLPDEVVMAILLSVTGGWKTEWHKFIQNCIKRIPIENMKNNPKLLKLIIHYNKQQNKIKENNSIYRSLCVRYKKEPEVGERCLNMI